MKFLTLGVAGSTGVLLAVALTATPAQAQTTYGPWFETSDCKAQRAGPRYLPRGPAMPGSPQVGGGYASAQECRWERSVTTCPRLFRSIRDCRNRTERSGYSATRPRS
jgi:hypothetical protein